LEEFLGMAVTPAEELSAKPTEELETLHQGLHRSYEKRFKQG
jgi:hypothetical protein